MDPTKLTNEGDGMRITLEDLLKANMLQKLIAEATIRELEQAKSDRDELELFRQREQARLNRQNPELEIRE